MIGMPCIQMCASIIKYYSHHTIFQAPKCAELKQSTLSNTTPQTHGGLSLLNVKAPLPGYLVQPEELNAFLSVRVGVLPGDEEVAVEQHEGPVYRWQSM